MSRPTKLSISAPFDPRHVSGVSIPGVTVPLIGQATASVPLEPDETPSHTFVATGNIEVPRRSNSIAHSLSRPSLRLKSSISMLRGRSQSNSSALQNTQDQKKEEERGSPPERTDMSPHRKPSTQHLRKKSSSSRLWMKIHRDEPAPVTSTIPQVVSREARTYQAERNNAPLFRTPSYGTPMPPPKATPYEYDYRNRPLPERLPTPPPKPEKALPNRPKRADSGTAIDLDDVPPEERPLGFQEIMAMPSFSDRMALYKRSRDYWATADHGLIEWVDKSIHSKPLPVPT